MDFTLDLNTLINGIILTLMGAGVRGIFSIRDSIFQINSKISNQELWTEMHEDEDNRRFEEIKDLIDMRKRGRAE